MESANKYDPGNKLDVKDSLMMEEKFKESKEVDIQPSMMGKDIMKNLKNKYKAGETNVQITMGAKTYKFKAMNIHQMVKEYAISIFEEQEIDRDSGKYSRIYTE